MALEHISLEQSQELIERGVTLIDVREPDECDEFIAGTHFVPLSLVKEGRATELPKQDTVLFYCRSGRRSTLFGDQLLALAKNAKHVVAMDGGFTAWKQEGYPIEKAARLRDAAGSAVLVAA